MFLKISRRTVIATAALGVSGTATASHPAPPTEGASDRSAPTLSPSTAADQCQVERLGAVREGCIVEEAGGASELAGGSGEPAVTFAGFHVFDDGTSRIFVKITKDVPVSVDRKQKQVDFLFRGAKIFVKNNKNPLITREFESPVMAARLVSEEDGAVLRVDLREAVAPTHRVSRHPDDSITVHIDFPAKGAREPNKPPGG